jgi:hypothetical protein
MQSTSLNFRKRAITSDILHEVVADLDLNPIPFNKDTPPRAIREVQTANMLQVGGAAADPPATSSRENAERAHVPGTKAEADGVMPGASLPTVTTWLVVAKRMG